MAKIKVALDEFKPHPRLIDERGATTERMKRAGENVYQAPGTGTVTMQRPIERALLKGVINREQGEAAQKFYTHWQRAGMAGQVGSADMTRVFGTTNNFNVLPDTENSIFHLQSLNQAIKELNKVGERYVWILREAVLLDRTFEQIGRELGWNNRPQATAAAVTMTREALNVLARQWGIS